MGDPVRTLIDDYLDSARQLNTPVARFSAAHDSGSLPRIATESAQLIPLSKPTAGEQYAFEVDLDACHGCKACVAACHSLNGLDETEAWRDVGLIHGGTTCAPYQQTVTTACHHCAEPGCLEGCPVLAYEKDPVTGIVRHLDDQCIGCQYCILKCPYDVPKYNERLGIVRKCDMCHQRLAEGEAPACAQACPTHAIRIVKVSRTVHAAGEDEAGTGDFLAAAPSATYTKPTTRYVSTREIPANTRPSDERRLRPQHAHLSLIVMLTLTQAGYGLLCSSTLAGAGPDWLARAAVALILVGLIASVTHLGKPLRAWRIFLGLRSSWLSREAVLLGASFGAIATAQALPLARLPVELPAFALPLLTRLGLGLGLAGLFCSAMIYIDTRRLHWGHFNTFLRMGGTFLCFALAAYAPQLAALALLAKLAGECLSLRRSNVSLAAHNTARLHLEHFTRLTASRFVLGLVAAGLLVSGLLIPALVALIAGELLERTLFFCTVDAPKMPGNP